MGNRGEIWVVIQLLLFVVILLTPTVDVFPFPLWLRVLGLVALVAGGLLGTFGVVSLGSNLSPFPRPKPAGFLISSGAYSIVRHPIYSGLILGTLGWALITETPLGILLAPVLFLFFDAKSRREERWLREAYPDYQDYQRRVKKLIPWVY